MLSILNNNSLGINDRTNLNFALAKAYEDIKDFDKQFKALNTGNSLRKKELNYSIERDFKLFTRIKEAFNPPPSILRKPLNDSSTITPIFILGMPRSGTSLVHQILDSHYKVRGMGELNYLNKSVFPIISKNNNLDKAGLTEGDLKIIREEYLNSISSLQLKEGVFVDKMPLNFRYIGFILSAIPEAKIIHTTRSPFATCWSIYKHYFSSAGHGWAYNLDDLAGFYAIYSNIMDFWHQTFPDKIYDLCYEDLTTNQEEETRKLLEYCELDWDENCLNFHTNKRAVKTASALQVRQKMYQGSSEAWKKHEEYLQPLIKALSSY